MAKQCIRWYFCVNCGHHGDYGFERQRSLKCEKCEYDDICELDKEEYEHYTAQRKEDD